VGVLDEIKHHRQARAHRHQYHSISITHGNQFARTSMSSATSSARHAAQGQSAADAAYKNCVEGLPRQIDDLRKRVEAEADGCKGGAGATQG
jgi:hypothetical protein